MYLFDNSFHLVHQDGWSNDQIVEDIAEHFSMISNEFKPFEVDDLPTEIQEKIKKIEIKTQDYDGLFFNLALAYGGRSEILEAVKSVATEVIDGSIEIDNITNEMVENLTR